MLQNLTGMHALVILAVVVLLFGASRLPALAKSVGQSIRILKDESAEKTPNSDGTHLTTAQGDTSVAVLPTKTDQRPAPAGIADSEQQEYRAQ